MPVTEKEETIDIPIVVKVTKRQLESVMISAIEGGVYGIGSWSPEQALRGTKFPHPDGLLPGVVYSGVDLLVTEWNRNDEVYNSFICRNVIEGGTLGFLEDVGDGPVWHTLTRERLLKGFGRWVPEMNKSGTISFDEETGVTEFDIDGPTADVIIQLALFDAIRYC